MRTSTSAWHWPQRNCSHQQWRRLATIGSEHLRQIDLDGVVLS